MSYRDQIRAALTDDWQSAKEIASTIPTAGTLPKSVFREVHRLLMKMHQAGDVERCT